MPAAFTEVARKLLGVNFSVEEMQWATYSLLVFQLNFSTMFLILVSSVPLFFRFLSSRLFTVAASSTFISSYLQLYFLLVISWLVFLRILLASDGTILAKRMTTVIRLAVELAVTLNG
jgi:hypothetical protein